MKIEQNWASAGIMPARTGALCPPLTKLSGARRGGAGQALALTVALHCPAPIMTRVELSCVISWPGTVLYEKGAFSSGPRGSLYASS